MKHVSFLGAGSWGTALAILCANNGHQVTIWSKVKAETDMLKEHREHLERLPGVKLPDSIVIEEDLENYMYRVEKVERQNSELHLICKEMGNQLSGCVQKIGIVRYNAFKDTGSDLSFALALLDEDNTGVF